MKNKKLVVLWIFIICSSVLYINKELIGGTGGFSKFLWMHPCSFIASSLLFHSFVYPLSASPFVTICRFFNPFFYVQTFSSMVVQFFRLFFLVFIPRLCPFF
jgi:hypothetical protein